MIDKNRGNRVAFETLGCKLNFSESSALAREFVENGFKRVKSSEHADIYVINTCSVTEHADKKCRNIIRKLHKKNPDAVIAVTGCYAQLKPRELLEIEGVDVVIGADEKSGLFMRVAELKHKEDKEGVVHSAAQSYSCAISEVESIFPAYSSDDRTRSFLKVQDGCDYNCSYCTIPLARGKSRNLPVSEIVGQAREIASKGIKEIVLTGVNTGDFGKSTGESFASLLTALNGVDGVERIRVSSVEPNLITEEIIDLIASNQKFLNHFHIPLQSGSNAVLAAMKRRYNRELFRDKVLLIKERIPYAFVGVDVIVGFPGESDREFMDTFTFLKNISPSFLHVFPYSRRDNTPAAGYSDQVPESIKKERVHKLTELSDALYASFREINRGREEEVLFERSVKGGMMEGYTGNYIKVAAKYDRDLIGSIVKVIL
jgi:threonylcarbamoyladenosine tRNA methylthiotransferase MtaB